MKTFLSTLKLPPSFLVFRLLKSLRIFKIMKKSIKDLLKSVILTLFSVFFGHWLSGVTGIEGLTGIGALGWIILFVYYLVFVYIGLKVADAVL